MHRGHRVRQGAVGARLVTREVAKAEHRVTRRNEALTERLGGTARRQAVLLLASVLALGSADTGAVGALAPELERSLHIGNVDVGLMVTVSGLATAAGLLPVGWATDRFSRSRMLTISIAIWGLAEAVSSIAVSFAMLLVVRLALGAMTATTGPTVASLTGDLFPSGERSRMYGFILTGELGGAGLGLLVASIVAGWSSWRVALLVLCVPSVLLAWAMKRYLPEPGRGGSSWLEPGARYFIPAKEVGSTSSNDRPSSPAQSPVRPVMADPKVTEVLGCEGVQARTRSVLDKDPMTLSWVQATRYVLRVPSNVMLVIASALGYFFFSGLETFALIYLKGHFHLDQAVALVILVLVGCAAVVGTILGGRLSDTLVHSGRVGGGLIVAAAGYVIAALALAPAFSDSLVAISLPLFLVAGFAVAAPNPGLDAARLDIVPARMWGRAEAVRSLLKSLLQALAPLAFGLMSELFGGRSQGFATSAQGSSLSSSATEAAGLEPTFLLMLLPLVAAGVIAWRGRRYYPGDVAAAAESERRFPPD